MTWRATQERLIIQVLHGSRNTFGLVFHGKWNQRNHAMQEYPCMTLCAPGPVDVGRGIESCAGTIWKIVLVGDLHTSKWYAFLWYLELTRFKLSKFDQNTWLNYLTRIAWSYFVKQLVLMVKRRLHHCLYVINKRFAFRTRNIPTCRIEATRNIMTYI